MKTKIFILSLILSAALGLGCNTQNSTTNNSAHSEMNHNNMNHQNMNNDQMTHSQMKSSPNATYDLQFIDTMIAHHQGAIEMTEMAETRAEECSD
jgi:uncharacterized protein (DUF305 family)